MAIRIFASLWLALLLATGAAAQGLTGQWRANDGGTYWLRQAGDQIYWYGENGTAFTNVYHGTMDANRIHGTWADVPRGGATSSGEMSLRIVNADLIVAERRTGGFSGSEWRRVGASAQGPANPPPVAAPIADLYGLWSIQFRDPYASYAYEGSFAPEGTRQRLQMVLKQTNHGFHATRIGSTNRDCAATSSATSMRIVCEGTDPTPATAGPYRSEYQLTLASDGVWRGTGVHQGGLNHQNTIEIRRLQR
jgi:hypothetical protein